MTRLTLTQMKARTAALKTEEAPNTMTPKEQVLSNLLYGFRIRLARFQRERNAPAIERLTRLIATTEAELAALAQ